MNYMKEVAQLLGVELGEEFKIEGVADNFRYKLTEEHLKFTTDGTWYILPATITSLLSGKDKVVKIPKPILTEKEKKYLSGVVGPFRDRVESIYKCSYTQNPFECIIIRIEDESSIILPNFKKNAMYKGMEPNKKYTLDELGL